MDQKHWTPSYVCWAPIRWWYDCVVGVKE